MGKWIEAHPDLWEFIKFNVLSNVSTIARFIMTWVGTAIFITSMNLVTPFKFLIFDYTSSGSHGIGGFLTFLIAEIIAQAVNFFVQKTWVFKSNADFSKSVPKYIVLAIIIVVVALILPGRVTDFCISNFGMGAGLASTVATVFNTILAVVVSYPLLKFWIMPKE